MEFAGFLAQAAVISLSGVMAPGPMTAVTIGQGNRRAESGLFIAMGHALVEVPLVMAIYFGMGSFLRYDPVQAGIGLVGGAFLVFMGISMIRGAARPVNETVVDNRSPVISGILLSAGNPYFLIWWISVGAFLVFRASDFGFMGFMVFLLTHWLLDLVWYGFLSLASNRGGRFFGNAFQRLVFLACGSLLIFFSYGFIRDAVSILKQVYVTKIN